jgi:hypothetical protein
MARNATRSVSSMGDGFIDRLAYVQHYSITERQHISQFEILISLMYALHVAIDAPSYQFLPVRLVRICRVSSHQSIEVKGLTTAEFLAAVSTGIAECSIRVFVGSIPQHRPQFLANHVVKYPAIDFDDSHDMS